MEVKAVVKSRVPPTTLYIGILGAKGHGKDTFANLVTTAGIAGRSFQIAHFADPLKELCSQVFGLAMDLFVTPELKESLLPKPIVIDMFTSSLSSKTGLHITPKGLLANTPRQLLQFVGTDYIRSADDSYWIRKAEEQILQHPRVIVPDVRFSNEMTSIKNIGGMLIRIIRIDADTTGDQHSSEVEVADLPVDLEVGVRTGDLALPERVAHLISLGKIKNLKAYDYRNIKQALALYQSGATRKDCLAVLGITSHDSNHFRFLLKYYGVPSRRSGTVTLTGE